MRHRFMKTHSIIITCCVLLVAVVLPFSLALAQPSPPPPNPVGGPNPPVVPNPVPPPSDYLSGLYKGFLGFVGIAALFAIVYGGVLYMFSGANLTKTEEAKRWIQNSFVGILL